MNKTFFFPIYILTISSKKQRLVVLAADISPVDVLSHIPGICEKKEVPYIWVRSRMELGTAAQTKKPTSVVLLIKPDEDSKLSGKFQKLNAKVTTLNPYL